MIQNHSGGKRKFEWTLETDPPKEFIIRGRTGDYEYAVLQQNKAFETGKEKFKFYYRRRVGSGEKFRWYKTKRHSADWGGEWQTEEID